MKSIHFKSPIHPTPAGLGGMMPDALRHLRAACMHGAAEGAALAGYCQLMQVRKQFPPGEKGLAGLMARAYGAMAANPAFWACGSAVPFCLSPKPKNGQYFLHKPRNADRSTPVLLLLHGYGGNLLYFPWAIQQAVPECILVAPSWQIDWSDGAFHDRRDYLEMALADASDRLGFRAKEVWLVPLSQGGPTAFQILAESPGKYCGLLGISTWGAASRIRKRIRLLHGDEDERISIDGAKETVRAICAQGGDVGLSTVLGANHFLLLSHPPEVKKFLRETLQS